MATLPTFPTFVTGDTSLANLNALAGAVSFLAWSPTGWHYYLNANQSVTANTATVVGYQAHAFDPDSTFLAGSVAVKTQGYYNLEASVQFSTIATSGDWVQIWIAHIAGANNPANGTTWPIGYVTQASNGTGSNQGLATFGTSRAAYVGDTFQVLVETQIATTLLSTVGMGDGGSDIAGVADGGCHFSGQWISEAP